MQVSMVPRANVINCKFSVCAQRNRNGARILQSGRSQNRESAPFLKGSWLRYWSHSPEFDAFPAYKAHWHAVSRVPDPRSSRRGALSFWLNDIGEDGGTTSIRGRTGLV